jgi:osmoprotectant transport system ATP-binding protein
MTSPPSDEPAIQKPAIEFDHASFRRNGRPLLQDLVLSVKQGETLVLLGRSGSGKTTTLKLINRLLLPTSGEVRVNGRVTTEWDPIRLRRSIGYVIQDGGLFPHFTVERNIALVPRIENWPRERVEARPSGWMRNCCPDTQANSPEDRGSELESRGLSRPILPF